MTGVRVCNDDLTPRELDVVRLLAEGCTNGEIADRLAISPLTSRFYVARLCDKVGVKGRTRLALWAIRTGIATLEGVSS